MPCHTLMQLLLVRKLLTCQVLDLTRHQLWVLAAADPEPLGSSPALLSKEET